MKRVMTAVLAVLLLATISIGGALPIYAESAHVHTVYEELGLGADLPEAIGPDPSGYEGDMSMPPLNARPISNYADFKSMNPGMSYYLTGDLVVYDTYEETFTGNFYGNGYTITTSAPLFRRIERSIVTDLVIEGEIEQDGALGALAMEAVAPELHNIINYANVTTITSNTAGGLIGTLVKSNFPTVIRYCENHGDVYGGLETGGFIGYMQGTYDEKSDAKKTATLEFAHCLNTGDITSKGSEVGGLVGQPGGGNSDYEWLYSITINNCANEGALSGSNVGGLFGEAHAGHVVIDSCYNTGDIEATGDGAGIAARTVYRGVLGSTVTVTNCYNTGDVEAGGDVAGILGDAVTPDADTLGCTLVIDNCQNEGTMTGNRTGGILGAANENDNKEGRMIDKIYIRNCTNNGFINSTSNYAGGIACRIDVKAPDSEVEGFYNANVVLEACVNNGEVQGTKSQIGGMVGYSDIAKKSGKPIGGEYNIEFYACVNNGYVHSANVNEWVAIGGMMGNTVSGAGFYYCVNNGELRSGGYVGGMAGVVTRTITAANCISMGKITGGLCIGGILGTTNNGEIVCIVNEDGTEEEQSIAFDEHTFYACTVVGDLVDCDYRDTIHAANKAMGGIAGRVFGDSAARYCSVLSNIKGVYAERNDGGGENSTLELGCTVSAIFGKMGGDALLIAQGNYFCGTLEAGSLGSKAFLANAPDSTQTDSWQIGDNYTNLSNLLTYLQGNVPSFEFAEVPDGVTDSASFLTVMNDALGEELFTHVTSCEGDVYTLFNETEMVYELTRTHADESYDYYTVEANDGEYHWMGCAVCGAADPDSVEAHYAAEGEKATCHTKLVCDECGVSFGDFDPDNHEDTTIEWNKTPTTHSAVTDCCGTIDAVPHTFEDGACTECGYACLHVATCGQGAVCEICGETYNGTDAHVWSTTEWVAVDGEDKHYRPCENCDAYDPNSGVACSESDYPADCLNYKVCTTCGQDFGELDMTVHVYPGRFTYEPNADDPSKCEKQYACCGTVAELVEHEAKYMATCSEKAVCINCKWHYGELDMTNHENDEVIYRINAEDPEKHDMVYECCGYTVTEAHKGGEATCNAKATCELCKNEYGAIDGEHAFDHKCDTQCDVCGLIRSTDGHAFGGWLVVEEATESTAGYQMRACVICGAVQEATIAPVTSPDSALLTMPEETAQSDAYIGVIVVAAAGAIVLGAVVGAIVHKKKKAK